MSDSFSDANDLFESLYGDLSSTLAGSYDAGVNWVKAKAQSAANAASWVWQALQGDWNDDRTVAQIAADAVLGIVPIVGQLLCLRDLIANAKKILEDASNKFAWIALVLTLIAIFPVLGAPAKGVLRIIFLFIRRYGGDVAKAVEAGLRPALMFLADPQVQRILGTSNLRAVLKTVAEQARSLKAQVTASAVLAKLDELIGAFKSVASRVKLVLPKAQAQWLDQALESLAQVRQVAEANIKQALQPVQRILDEVAAKLEGEAGKIAAEHTATTNARNVHTLPSGLQGVDPRILSTSRKGLYGELISDHYMETAGHRSMLPAERQIRSLEDKPRGRGIDGIYANAKPPPPYIVSETKYRTETGEYISSDGTKSTELLSTTKGSPGYASAKQMSDKWIEPRLVDELGDDMADKVMDGKYERWLMIVGPTGKVEQITKLDGAANAISVTKP